MKEQRVLVVIQLITTITRVGCYIFRCKTVYKMSRCIVGSLIKKFYNMHAARLTRIYAAHVLYERYVDRNVSTHVQNGHWRLYHVIIVTCHENHANFIELLTKYRVLQGGCTV